ncbi:OLC1v1021587C4 [Oldenlandia corymbosa var. corymbosa]|uniref:OLC1v1021587C4 n=1 Tax=Oldenlandia corymbosa var. corymbosa TaxID=529605 RepID=A0AAV1BW09_OLDCO|nr:OLC1v1021587C4 [Oldenlandia corymbosa var. corymbosa]
MDQIEHKHVEVNGLKLHVAEAGGRNGSGVVLFCHGFPEIWYSWRHQMIAVAKAGYRAIAPDYRGYGLSDPPTVPEEATYSDFINDLHSLLDVLGIPKVFLIAKDFGSRIAHLFTLLHPRRVAGIVSLGIPFVPPKPPPFAGQVPEGFYMARWKEPGRAEADFGRFDPKTVVRNIYVLFSGPDLPVAEKDQEIMDMVDSSVALPPWFTEEDLANYGSLYEKSGFRTALQVPYRTKGDSSSMEDPKIEVPALLIMGEKDYCMKIPGMEDYIRSGEVKVYVPNLEIKYMPEGSHFVQEQFPDEVNQLLLSFLTSQTQS